ncbi:MAG: cytochrome P450, partial [Gammaproteobacteria bacterium]|nr:cytochrome P450 [Gammaproteobacteria bacterium]
AVEEVLRFESSNQLGNRTTTQATTIGGVEIPKDSVLTLCIGAANRDPAIFCQPELFDIGRTPNPHLSFGAGIHSCAGLSVARLEGQIAIGRFFDRFCSVSMQHPPQRARRARFRGFESIQVTLKAR